MKKKFFALMLTLCMVLTMMPSMAWAEDTPTGLSVKYNGNYVTEGVIEIEEGGLCEMPIYFDGKQVESTEGIADPMAEPPANGICLPGVSPDGKVMEIRMGGTANEGETCEVPLTYRGKTITLTVRVVAGIRLKFEDNTVMKTGRNITGRKTATAQIMFGEKEITENYTVSAKSSAVLKVENKGQGKMEFTTTGNGKSDIVISYQKDEKNCESTFIWNGTDISNDDAGAHNVALQINGIEKKTGEVIVLAPNKSVTGKVLHNGNELNKYDVEVVYNDWEEERECSANKNDNEGFTIESGKEESYYTLKFTDDKDSPKWEAYFTIQVRNEPEEYVLQFCDMEKQSDENWEALGYGTISIFKNTREKKYVKYVITDGEMKRIDEDYFVKVNPETDIEVQVCVGGDKYEKVKANENPFSFSMVKGRTIRTANRLLLYFAVFSGFKTTLSTLHSPNSTLAVSFAVASYPANITDTVTQKYWNPLAALIPPKNHLYLDIIKHRWSDFHQLAFRNDRSSSHTSAFGLNLGASMFRFLSQTQQSSAANDYKRPSLPENVIR